MAEKIRVHTGRLGMDAQRMLSLAQNMEKQIDEMRQSVTVLGNMWEGPGQAAFQKAFLDDVNTILAAVQEMEGVCGFDENAKAKYEQCEKKIGALVDEIKV